MKKCMIAFGLTALVFAVNAPESAQAADCVRNIKFTNTTNGPLHFKIQSRTRANATWYDGNLLFSDRRKILLAGRTTNGTITYPILGCGVKRKIRIRIFCLDAGQRTIARKVINVSRGEWHKPYDLKSDLSCS